MRFAGWLLVMIAVLLASSFTERGVAQSAKEAAAEIPTGPEVGEKIPEFEAVDHRGRRQTFESLKGPNGLLLLFHRSADW